MSPPPSPLLIFLAMGMVGLRPPLAAEKRGGGEAIVWRHYGEVFDLAAEGNSILAATNGGLLRDGRPVPSVSGLRSILSLSPLVLEQADGHAVRPDGSFPIRVADRKRDLAHGLLLDPGDPWPVGPPPPNHAYAALREGRTLWAGTADGLYRRSDEGPWQRVPLPSDLPLPRPNGLAFAAGQYVVGGLGGLYVGRPGAWRKATDAAIRQIATVADEVWAVHGDGALDRLDPANDRIYPDVLSGNARRPWTSCVGWDGKTSLFGGQGGWAERGGASTVPVELRGDVVTAIAGRPGVRFVGSQKTGLLRVRGATIKRWNPGNGLNDPWVTALLLGREGLMVGTARGGLFRLVGDRLTSLRSPTQRVTALASWRGRTVVGGMDGAWIAEGRRWTQLPTQGEETTSLAVIGDRLAVTTAAGVFFIHPG